MTSANGVGARSHARWRPWAAACLAMATACVLVSPASGAPVLGQVDTFADGTTQGWRAGGGPGGGVPPLPPSHMSSGGPGGVGDGYLLLQSLGSDGPGSRLTAFNTDQWAGDYVTAGITTLVMDVRNFGMTDLQLRLALFNGPPLTAPTEVGITSTQLVAAGGDWTRISFRIDAAGLTMLLGSADDLLRSVTELRLFHGPDPAFPPPAVAAALGVDNITATQASVPEPGIAVSLAMGLVAVVTRRLSRR